MRKLATIRIISEIQPIQGADSIEKARIDGWWCVVKKDEFVKNDLCVYFEIDSLLPMTKEFEFLAKGNSPKTISLEGGDITGYRLKTIKLRGQVSQGLALPLGVFGITDPVIGADLSDKLRVYKYEPPIPACLAGEIKGAFPGFLPRTDEERIQNCLSALSEHYGKSFVLTEKLDGTSCTIYRHNESFGVCSRNLELKENPGNTYWKVANKYNLCDKMPSGFAVQGEVIGEGIQGNRYKIKGQDIFVFHVIDIQSGHYLGHGAASEFCNNLGLKHVPILETICLENQDVSQFLSKAEGKSCLSDSQREGVVYRLNERGPKVSFKVISNNFLLNER